jgi:hypothetical protein
MLTRAGINKQDEPDCTKAGELDGGHSLNLQLESQEYRH